MAERKIMAQVFSNVALVYDKFVSIVTLGGIHKWQKKLINLMGDSGNWLDVGTGTGEVLLKLQNASLRVGIDVAFGMLTKSKGKCTTCHFILADAQNMPFKDGVFDKVSLSLVFRHLENQENFLKETKRITSPGAKIGLIDIKKFAGSGILAFLMKTVFLPFGILIFGKGKWNFFINSIEKSFTIQEVKNLLESQGFKVIKVETSFLGLVYIMVAQRV
ncbi:MAG TPA: methyltransferase domain-containing protein [Aquifex aeolicus]|nr:methyltransferase domain-containing protein [Aquifex aeolicus]